MQSDLVQGIKFDNNSDYNDWKNTTFSGINKNTVPTKDSHDPNKQQIYNKLI